MADIFFLKSLDLLENRYEGVSGVTDYEYDIIFLNLKMADAYKNIFDMAKNKNL